MRFRFVRPLPKDKIKSRSLDMSSRSSFIKKRINDVIPRLEKGWVMLWIGSAKDKWCYSVFSTDLLQWNRKTCMFGYYAIGKMSKENVWRFILIQGETSILFCNHNTAKNEKQTRAWAFVQTARLRFLISRKTKPFARRRKCNRTV